MYSLDDNNIKLQATKRVVKELFISIFDT